MHHHYITTGATGTGTAEDPNGVVAQTEEQEQEQAQAQEKEKEEEEEAAMEDGEIRFVKRFTRFKKSLQNDPSIVPPVIQVRLVYVLV